MPRKPKEQENQANMIDVKPENAETQTAATGEEKPETIETATGEGKKEEPTAKVGRKKPETGTIPENALRTLKIFSNHKKLYVSKNGGAFTTPYGDAILYDNPFYEKK